MSGTVALAELLRTKDDTIARLEAELAEARRDMVPHEQLLARLAELARQDRDKWVREFDKMLDERNIARDAEDEALAALAAERALWERVLLARYGAGDPTTVESAFQVVEQIKGQVDRLRREREGGS